MRIGFIGLGNIGYPMAARLLEAGHELTVHDLVREKGERLVRGGAHWADTAGATVRAAETVITSLPGPAEVRQVFETGDGLLANFRDGQTWLEMSTSDRALITTLAEQLAGKGVTTLEATVTGGVVNAYTGGITVLVGGDERAFRASKDVLETLAAEVIYLGALGNATVAKLITNMIAFVHEAALAEGLVLGKRAGVEVGALLEAIRHSYAGSFVADLDGPRILAGDYDSAFGVELALKDMRLTRALGEDLNVPLVFGALASAVLERSRVRFGPHSDTLLAVKTIEEESGESLQP